MDADACYEDLVRRNEAMLLAYVLGIVRDPTLAEDVTQEALVIGCRKYSTLVKKESAGAWLRTIARNLALHELRRRNLEMPFDENTILGMEDIFQALEPAPASELWNERLKLVEDCFQRLPDKLREVCQRHYFEDQPLRQITDLMRIGLDAVKKRLERARNAIRECLEKRLRLEDL